MKRILFLLGITATLFVGCKKEKDEPISTTDSERGVIATIDCENHPVILEMGNQEPENILQWIKDNGQGVCDGDNGDLIECLEGFHQISNTTKFDSLAKLHPDNNPDIKYYKKTWEEVENVISKIKCYDEYLAFNFLNGELELKKISSFTTDESCYSRPFLLGMSKKQMIKPRDTIFFTKSHVGGYDKVIFEARRYSTPTSFDSFYYDISDFPGIINFKKFTKK